MENSPDNLWTAYKILAIIGISLGGLISLLNWWTLYQSWRTKKFISAVPIVGALLLGLGLCYFDSTRPFAFLSIVVDYGTLMLVLVLPGMLKEFWSTSVFRLKKTIYGKHEGMVYELRMYKGGSFVLKGDATTKPAETPGLVGFSIVGDWNEKEDAIVLRCADSDRVLELKASEKGFTSGPILESGEESMTIKWK